MHGVPGFLRRRVVGRKNGADQDLTEWKRNGLATEKRRGYECTLIFFFQLGVSCDGIYEEIWIYLVAVLARELWAAPHHPS